MKTKRILVILIALCLLLAGCTKAKNTSTHASDGTPLIVDELIARKLGNPDSDIVVVYSQGGPTIEVETDMLEELQSSHELLKDAYFVQPHQVQTESEGLFNKKEITFEDAINYDTKTVLNIAAVVKYYKEQGKQVYVVGISFGAFVTADLIAEYGTDFADGYAIMVGRLDIDKEFWQAFSEGKGGSFENGVTPVIEDTDDLIESNMYRLAAGIGHKRFTEKLADMDLSSVAYAYGKTDQAVGKLTDAEILFLENHGAKIFPNDGGHGDASTYETTSMMDYLLNK